MYGEQEGQGARRVQAIGPRWPKVTWSRLDRVAGLIASTRRASNRHPRLTMYIKTLTIQGFKSRTPSKLTSTDAKAEHGRSRRSIMLWLGGTGAGRVISSLVRVLGIFPRQGTYVMYLAIRFVLSDAYTAMAKEERQALLHEGVSVAQTMSAYGTRFPSHS